MVEIGDDKYMQPYTSERGSFFIFYFIVIEPIASKFQTNNLIVVSRFTLVWINSLQIILFNESLDNIIILIFILKCF